MKERPILFSGPMVKAILEGRKTQTRRIVKPTRNGSSVYFAPDNKVMMEYRDGWGGYKLKCPYGNPGDRLWVRERHQFVNDKGDAIIYAADGAKHYVQDNGEWLRTEDMWKQRPSIHMPRWASRITLNVVSVRVERLNDCSAVFFHL